MYTALGGDKYIHLKMDRYIDTIKARVKLSLQNEANQTQSILGEAFYKKCLWTGEHDSYIDKMVIINGKVFYQINGETNILKLKNHGITQSITPAEFYEPFLPTIKLYYEEPEFLTLGETIVKTEKPYEYFMVAEHFTKKIYFITPAEYLHGGSLYAADISKGAKEVVAEKVEIGTGEVKGTTRQVFALAVDQISGDIVLAICTRIERMVKYKIRIQSWQKLAHFSEWLTYAEISSCKEDVKPEA